MRAYSRDFRDGPAGRSSPNYRRRRSQPSHRLPKDEGEAIAQINGEMQKWGVDPSKNDTHALFAKGVEKAVVDCFNANIVQDWEPFSTSSAVLTGNIEESLHILLEHNLKQVTEDGSQTTKRETSDLVKDKYDASMPFPPYSYNLRGGRRLSWAYNELNIDEEDLDPFVRFTYEDKDIKEYIADQFGQVADEKYHRVPWYHSQFIRALTLYEAVSNTHRCLACNKEGTLTWNSSMRSDFCHLICTDCGSTYSLCSVANSQRVQKLFDKKTHYKGSYARFHQLKAILEESTQGAGKMFLVFATRSSDESETNGSRLPVFVAEMLGAMPHLNGDSFSLKRIRIKSNIVFAPINGRKPWFSIAIPPEIDILDLSMKVFHTYFDKLEEKMVQGAESETTESSVEVSAKAANDGKQRQVANLKKVLAQIEDIKGKQERGVALEKWETDLLGREKKVVMKLEEIIDH